MLLDVMLTIYICLVVLNLVFMLTLHFLHDRQGYYKTAAGIWLGSLLTYLAEGYLIKENSSVHHLFGIPFASIIMYSLANLASRIYNFSWPRQKFIAFTILCWVIGLVMHYGFHAGFMAVSAVVCLGVAAPALMAGYKVLRSWRDLTVIDKIFGVMITAEGVHILDYPVLRNIESAAAFGFSFGLFLVYFASMTVPVVINRRLSTDFSSLLQKEVDAKTQKLEASVQQLRVAQAQLMNASKLAALGEMAGGMAHEINTPLAVVKTRTRQLGRLITAPNFDASMAHGMIQAIESTTDHIAKVIQGLRTFSRNSEGDAMQPHMLAEMINSTLDLCAQRMANLGINFRMETVPQVTINCRPEQISQVLINILNNASDAIVNLTEKWISLTFRDEGESVKLMVTDSGHGIPSEIEQKIFQPFFTTKPVGAGTGLGLSISKGIVENHKGSLFLDKHSANTCFVINLPKAKTAKGVVA